MTPPKKDRLEVLTLEWLDEVGACPESKAWAKEKWGKRKGVKAKTALLALIKADKLDWANWAVVRLMEKPDQVRYAIFAAEQVIGIFEKKYPEDKRPRQAIEAARAWVKNPTEENRQKARASADDAAAYAAYAAYAAAYADDAAAYAAYAAYAAAYADDAAAYAAYAADASAYAAAASAAYAYAAAASAASAADASAYAAAYAAAYAYARRKMKTKIIRYGMGLVFGKVKS